jgi:hypothetical protein
MPWVSSSETVLTSRGSSHSCVSKGKLRSYPSPSPPPLLLSSPICLSALIRPDLHFGPCSLFQLPVFVLGAFGLWRGELHCVSIVPSPPPCFSYIFLNRVSDTPRIYGLLALYGASTSTAALACLAMILDVPTTSAATLAQKVMSITSEQRELLLWRYVPFFIIPLCMGVDMAFRLHKLASAGMRAHYY